RAKRGEVAFREVIDHDFIGLSPGSALQDYLARHAAQAGRTFKLRVRLRGFEAVCRMVAAGVGLAIVPETAAERCRRTMAIPAVRPTDPWTLRNLTICVRKLDARPLQAQRLVEHLRTGGQPTAGKKPRAPSRA